MQQLIQIFWQHLNLSLSSPLRMSLPTGQQTSGTCVHKFKLTKRQCLRDNPWSGGMNICQTSNPRITYTFHWEKSGERWLIIKQIILTYNLHARLVCINQIQNFYMPHLHTNARSIFDEDQFILVYLKNYVHK